MRRPRALLLAAALACACVDEVTVETAPDRPDLRVHETRAIDLRYLRLDVRDFDERITIADLARLPEPLLEETWLLDLDAAPLVFNLLTRFVGLPSEMAYSLPRPTENLWRLLDMTPANANVTGTRLQGLFALGEAVGLSPARVLADLALIDQNQRIIPTELAAHVVVERVVGSHPNAQRRPGPVTAEHPDGLYPVTPGSIPVSLADVASDFRDLSVKFGPAPLDPANPLGPKHPGFVVAASGLSTTGEFVMSVRASLNALPFKGVDLTDVTRGNVNSIRGQIAGAIDFTDPEWLTIEGLTPEVTIGELTMAIYEDPAYIPGGSSREPVGRGDSPAWDLPEWELERVIIETARIAASYIPAHCTGYAPQGAVREPLRVVEVCIDETGWVEIRLDPSVVLDAPPPAPAYFWDLLLEVAEERLHDGGVPEGRADPVFTLHEVPVGLSADELSRQVRQNFEASPIELGKIAERLNDVAYGDPDLYYVSAGDEADWLFFIVPADLRTDAAGVPVRPYRYERPGFFADAALTRKISSKVDVRGDTEHEKVRVAEGSVVFAEDDEGRRYEIRVGPKPSPHRISLWATRIE